MQELCIIPVKSWQKREESLNEACIRILLVYFMDFCVVSGRKIGLLCFAYPSKQEIFYCPCRENEMPSTIAPADFAYIPN